MIVCFGDSITRGRGPDEESYPRRLAALSGRLVVNAGVNGDTIARALKRLPIDVLSLNPGLVIVEIGANDHNRERPAAAVAEDFRALIGAVRGQSECAIADLFPEAGATQLAAGYTALYREEAERQGCLYIPDIYRGLRGRPDCWADENHPNAAGNAIIARNIHAALKRGQVPFFTQP